jgi:hypothetical protein
MLTIASTSFGTILKEAFDSGPVLQVIKNLVITPNPNSATFTFQTRFASSPSIKIYNYLSSDHTKDIAPANLVTSNDYQLVGIPRKKTHNYRLPRPADWTPDNYPGLDEPLLSPLSQDSHYWFAITADSANVGIIPAVTIGRFWTSQRSATAIIQELIVYQYGSSDIGSEVQGAVNSVVGFLGGSPPNPNIYHLDLAIGLFDQVNGPMGQLEKTFDSTQNNDDLLEPYPDQPLQAPNASDFLWLSSYGQGNGGAWGLGGFTGPSVAPDPNLSDTTYGVSAQGPWAEAATQSPRLPDSYMEQQSTAPFPLQLILDSGDYGTSYEVIAWFSFAFVPPRHAPLIYASPIASLTDGLHASDKAKFHYSHKLGTADEGTLAFPTANKVQVLVPGAGHTLWSQTLKTVNTTRKALAPWTKLGENLTAPIVVLPNHEDTIDMVACGLDGNAKYANWDGTAAGAAKVKWHDLGQIMSEEIAIVRGTKSLQVFLLDSQGAVIQCPVGADGKPHKATSLEGNLKTGLQALATGEGEIQIFGLGSKGDIWHCTISESATSTSKPTWTSLGGTHSLQLTVLPEEKNGLVIFAINKDRSVFRKTLKGKTWTPSGHDWKELGVLDKLFGPLKA